MASERQRWIHLGLTLQACTRQASMPSAPSAASPTTLSSLSPSHWAWLAPQALLRLRLHRAPLLPLPQQWVREHAVHQGLLVEAGQGVVLGRWEQQELGLALQQQPMGPAVVGQVLLLLAVAHRRLLVQTLCHTWATMTQLMQLHQSQAACSAWMMTRAAQWTGSSTLSWRASLALASPRCCSTLVRRHTHSHSLAFAFTPTPLIAN